MANDFGSNFLRGFQPNFANMFNDSYRYAAIEGERERQRKEQEKAQQEQAGILSQLIKGTKEVPFFQNNQVPLMNAGQSFGKKEMPLGRNEMAGLIGQADNSTLQRYKLLQSLNEVQQQNTVKVGNKFYKESSQYKNLPEGKPLWEEPSKKVTEDFVDAGTIEGLEQFKDYKVNRIVTENPDGTKEVKYGQPFTWKKQTINVNTGSMDDDLSKETTAILNKYQKEQQDIMAKLEAVNRGETVYDVTPFGFRTVVSKKDLETRLSSTNTQYSSFIKNNAGVETIRDYSDIKSQLDPKDPQLQPKQWKTVLDYYTSGKRDAAWFKEQIHLFSSEYGYDPLSKFGIK